MSDEKNVRLSDFYVTASGIVSEKPCWLYSVVLSATGAGQNTAGFHNGQDSAAPLIMTVSCIQYATFPIVFNQPKYFSKGVYVNVVAGTIQLSVQYLEELR